MRIRFDRGTLVCEPELPGDDPAALPHATWDDDIHAWRVPAEAHRAVTRALRERGERVTDEVRTG